jgi:hypothetical protein
MKEIYTTIEQRGFVWRCANSDLKSQKYRKATHSQGTKVPCGKWNAYWGRKWFEVKESPRWVSKCLYCGRRKQLNRGKVFPEPPRYLESKEQAEAEAERRNAIPETEWGWE